MSIRDPATIVATREWPSERRERPIDRRSDRRRAIAAGCNESLPPTDDSRFLPQGHHNPGSQLLGEECVELIKRVQGSCGEPVAAPLTRRFLQRGDASARFTQGILLHGSVGLRDTSVIRRRKCKDPHI